jgi:hypothetical protein
MKNFAVLLMILILNSCAVHIDGDGNEKLKTETRNLKDFKGIHVSSGIDVEIIQGDEFEVNIQSSEEYLPSVKTKVQGENLIISRESQDNIDAFFDGINGKSWRVKAFLTMPTLNYIKASSGADVLGKGQFKSEHAKVELSSGSDLDIEFYVDDLILKMSSGSDVDIKGEANNLDITASSGSDLDAFDFIVEVCVARLSSGSDANLHVTKTLDVKASGGSDVKFKGNAEIIRENVSGASDIKKLN